jgi:hypothetical protein
MKKVLFVLAIGAFAACNSGTSTETKTDSVKVDSTKVDSVKVMTDSSAKKDTTVKKVDSATKK